MQLLLIFGIGFAIAAVAFALQNNVPVTVSFVFWSFDGSLAIILLMSVGLGALIAGLVSSPTMIKGQWSALRLRRQVGELEKEKATLEQHIRDGEKQIHALEVQLEQLSPQLKDATEAPKPYVGLKTLLTAGENSEGTDIK
ncbi:MAG: lipopolysaccharide assembly protein LapA domain-containing protein [Sulfuritalea sp.]|nr:lipopolysaccharide assembly protein LapA domain-containing protein [Sulfuritalea sp.]